MQRSWRWVQYFARAVVIFFTLSLMLIGLISESDARSVDLEFIDDNVFATGTMIDGKEFGGISGLAWNSEKQVFFAISDDRGSRAPVRYYHLKFQLSGAPPNEVFQIEVVKTVILKDANGSEFPPYSIDPEAISILPSGNILISSEPSPQSPVRILEFTEAGQLVQDWGAPEKFKTIYTPSGEATFGTRTNFGFEAMRVDRAKGLVILGIENALVQDDETASSRNGSVSRILTLPIGQTSTKENQFAEYAYFVEKAPGDYDSTVPQTRGLVEFLVVDGKYWSLERSYIQGQGNFVHLYSWERGRAADIKHLPSLRTANYKVVSKKLVLDFSTIANRLGAEHPRIDNIEAAALGPELNDGSRLVLFASDNNFNSNQATQFLAFRLRN